MRCKTFLEIAKELKDNGAITCISFSPDGEAWPSGLRIMHVYDT